MSLSRLPLYHCTRCSGRPGPGPLVPQTVQTSLKVPKSHLSQSLQTESSLLQRLGRASAGSAASGAASPL